jgi:hypothetical protein
MDSFWQAVSEHNWEQPEVKIDFRLYYDEHGNVVCYSMEDLPGNYIEIDIETYRSGSPHVRVINGRVHQLASAKTTSKLVPSDIGQPCDTRYMCSSRSYTGAY